MCRKKKAIILDRDGTLNEDQGYVHRIKDFQLLPGIIEGLNLLKNKFIFFIISNQSGIGKGYYTFEEFWKFNNHLTSQLEQKDIKIMKTYFCPHRIEDNCDCRKPKLKYIKEIISEYNIDIKNSWVLGDHPSDVQLGINSGSRSIYLLTGHGNSHLKNLEDKRINPTYIAKDFLTAIRFIVLNL
ncbi:MAG: HAD family hydrolase [Candidatus Lokiarchaeota archaeon]|nr:HAD family hydrolase [Candidatus Lokiarchaeota archaeon]